MTKKVDQVGLEPTTFGFPYLRSYQLSYRSDDEPEVLVTIELQIHFHAVIDTFGAMTESNNPSTDWKNSYYLQHYLLKGNLWERSFPKVLTFFALSSLPIYVLSPIFAPSVITAVVGHLISDSMFPHTWNQWNNTMQGKKEIQLASSFGIECLHLSNRSSMFLFSIYFNSKNGQRKKKNEVNQSR